MSQADATRDPVPIARARIAGGGRVHLAGIGGIGMAGLALHLHARGLAVSGCDADESPNLAWLRARGIPATAGHDPAHAAGADWIIRSAAVPDSLPELQQARALGLPIFRRGEILPALLPADGSCVVAGSHGKTTTATFLARLLQAAGQQPSFCVGGHLDGDGTMAAAGKDPFFVAEGDESDGTLALYAPALAIVTNIEFDHMEHFADAADFEACFLAFMRRARRLLFGADDPRAARLAGALPHAVGFGFSCHARYRADAVETGADRIAFTLVRDGHPLARLALPVPGRHNVLNALGAAAAFLELGFPPHALPAAAAALSLPRRRFERLVSRPDLLVVSDYAHHPSEVAAAIHAARCQNRGRLLALFQPHRYTRTRALGADFPAAFSGAEELTLVPVYPASEAPLEGGALADLYRHCREAGLTPRLARSRREAWLALRLQLQPGDLLLILGAGNVDRLAAQAQAELAAAAADGTGFPADPTAALAAETLPATRIRRREPLGPKTTFGVGGAADLWAEVGSEADLETLLARAARLRIPVTPFGNGSNLLIPDTGLRGIALRLDSKAFGAVHAADGLLIAGAAASGSRLLDAAEAAGWRGLEWLEGIPGRVGGLVRMNAGAQGGAMADRVAWVRAAGADGVIRRFQRADLLYSYRACPTLANTVIVEAAFRLTPGSTAASRADRSAFRAARAWMSGLRCAGSVFKNPPGHVAGRLIEEAGWKGAALGGARVSARHANILVAETGCRASDLMALIDLIRESVARRTGLRLELELAIPAPPPEWLPDLAD